MVLAHLLLDADAAGDGWQFRRAICASDLAATASRGSVRRWYPGVIPTWFRIRFLKVSLLTMSFFSRHAARVLPNQADTSTCVTRKIQLNIPILSSAMDTVTESHLAIALAQQGGIGIIHRNMPIERQAEEVDRVKRSESGMIVDPVTIDPDQKIADALEVMKRFRISGVPVTRHGKLVGILTNRDLRFETRFDLPVSSVMTKENLITVPVGTTLEEAQQILHKHRVEKLLVVDDDYYLKGLITVKDIQKKLKYPNAAKDEQGRLRVGAALGATGDFLERAKALVAKKVDVLVIDTAHGHSERVMEAVRHLKNALPDVQLIAGQRRDLRRRARSDRARRRWREGRHRPGLDLHDARGQRRRRAADHRHPANARKATRGTGRAADLRRRHQVLGRYHQGDRRGRRLRHDRQPVRGNRRKPGRNDSLSGPHLQELSRHGIARRDGAGQFGPLCAGCQRQTGAGRHRRPRAVQRARWRIWCFSWSADLRPGMGYCGCAHDQGIAGEGAVPASHLGGSCAKATFTTLITKEAPNYRLE